MNNFDQTILEKTLVAIAADAGMTSRVLTNRPKSMTNVSDFCVCRVSMEVKDLECYGTTRVYFHLYAKDNDNLKNGAKLSYMQSRLIAAMPASSDYYESGELKASYEFSTNPTILSDKADDYGFHSRTISFETIIKSI